MRMRKRNCCSSSVMENQYLIRMIPERTSMRSKSGTSWKNCSTWSGVAKPMTRSTLARLYQERSKSTISPAGGQVRHIALKVPLGTLPVLGADRATPHHPGFRRWVIRLMTPPLPAESRPSKSTATLAPVCWTQ